MRVWLLAVVVGFGCTEGNPGRGGEADAAGADADAPDAGAGGAGGAGGEGGVAPECTDGAREADFCVGGGERTRFCVDGRWGEWQECPPCADGLAEERACGQNERGIQRRICADGAFGEWQACEDPDVCLDGATEEGPCGVNGTGVQQRACVEGRWAEWGPCDDAAACVDGDTEARPCGLNGNGQQIRACAEGAWGEYAECVDPDECIEGAEQDEACGVENGGRRARACLGGRWAEWGPCDDPDRVCEPGDEERVPCGLNGRGRLPRACEGERWVDAGPCEDADVCVDGAVAAEACGLNGAGRQERRCVDGQWGDLSPCADPDECLDGAEEDGACGLNGRGGHGRVCLGGRWGRWSACEDPDACVDGAEEPSDEPCGLNGRGRVARICVAGAWSPADGCADPDACVDGAEEARPCGRDGAGRRARACLEGQWGPWGACDAEDPCPDPENPACGPGRPEVCNGLDDDHDGEVDEGLIPEEGRPLPAPTDFDRAVDASIEAGLAWLRGRVGADGHVEGDRHSALAALAFLERRDNTGLGAPLGYRGLDAEDQELVRRLLAAAIRGDRALTDPEAQAYAYTSGAAAMALSAYLHGGGPEVIDPALPVEATEALSLVVAALARSQGDIAPNNRGGWNYRQPGPAGDTSTTHFALNGLAAAAPFVEEAGGTIPAVVRFLESAQNADGGVGYNPASQSSSSMSAAGLWMYRLAEVAPADPRVEGVVGWLADPYLFDRMQGGFTPTSTWYYFWSLTKALSVTIAPDDLRFAARDPVEAGHPDATPGWFFDLAVTVMGWQDEDGAWGRAANGSPRGWSETSSHVFALLTLERAFGGVRPAGADLGFVPRCADGVDNDGDGLIDAADPECRFACTPLERPRPACSDHLDNDGDGLIDGADPGCADGLDDAEADPACANRIDDDEDGHADWPADPGCHAAADPDEGDPVEVPECANGRDDDGDGLVDFGGDPGCLTADQASEGAVACPEGVPVSLAPRGVVEVRGAVPAGRSRMTTRCGGRFGEHVVVFTLHGRTRVTARVESEAFDAVLGIRSDCGDDLAQEIRCNNDRDAADPNPEITVDLEPGTWFVVVDSQFGAGDFVLTLRRDEGQPACADGEDNDRDGAIDLADPGCSDAADPDEVDPARPPACANGQDDDADGHVDWPEDPGCLAAGDPDERTPDPPPPCSDGRDNDADGDTDYPADHACASAAGRSEFGRDAARVGAAP